MGRSGLKGSVIDSTLMLRLLMPALLFLHGCVTVPPPAAPPERLLQSFTLQGRVSVQYGEQSLSGQLNWNAGEKSDEVLLSSPLGQGLASISRNEQGVTLTRPGESPVTAENVEVLTQTTLGFRLPLTGLRYWIQAKPDPAHPSEVRVNAAGGVEQIAQDGWKIDYLQYQENRPRKIHVTREGLEIRLVIDEWQTN
jgi:outer membrane lipoprotein LolB